jgi:hypothetical protein
LGQSGSNRGESGRTGFDRQFSSLTKSDYDDIDSDNNGSDDDNDVSDDGMRPADLIGRYSLGSCGIYGVRLRFVRIAMQRSKLRFYSATFGHP